MCVMCESYAHKYTFCFVLICLFLFFCPQKCEHFFFYRTYMISFSTSQQKKKFLLFYASCVEWVSDHTHNLISKAFFFLLSQLCSFICKLFKTIIIISLFFFACYSFFLCDSKMCWSIANQNALCVEVVFDSFFFFICSHVILLLLLFTCVRLNMYVFSLICKLH